MSEPFLIRADAVVPMEPGQPAVLRDAGVVIEGERIAGVGEIGELRRRFGELRQEGEGGGILLPGLVNAHTHLELSYLSSTALPGGAGSFPTWVSKLMASYPPAETLEKTVRDATAAGAAESLAFGVTTVGDISRHVRITRPALAAGPLRVTSFGEVVALGTMRDKLPERLDAAADRAFDSPFLRTGVSPHAPYTVEGPALQRIVRRAVARRLPICMHLAELEEEAVFLRDLSGPLGRAWDLMLKMNIIDDAIPAFPGGPVRWAQSWGLLIYNRSQPPERTIPVLLAHVNYCDNAELMQIAAAQASVAYCPRTHAFFGHPPHRYRDMLDAGINVCLGTDSRASSPDLSVLREARLLVERDRLSPVVALEMITRNGAAALGMGGEVGTLAEGKRADVIRMPLPGVALSDEDLLRDMITKCDRPAALYIGGTRINVAWASRQ